MPSRPLTVLALLAALAYAGCGGSRESERDDVEATVTTFYTAVADKNAKRACNAISEKGRQEISDAAAQGGKKKRSCEEVFDVVLAFSGDQFAKAKDVEVTDVKLDGDQATAAIRVNDRDSKVALLKEDGRWKLRGLSSTGS